jgi:nucleotide-binding universal stress UspA family protein
MRTILLPVDGSMRSGAAVQFVIRQARLGQIGTVHLVNVQPRIGSYIGRFLRTALVQDFYREEGEKAIERAKRFLDEAGIVYHAHIYAGDIVETIARAAKELAVDEIVMSANHRGVVGSFDLHSVVGRVLRRVTVPVSVVNYPATDMPIESTPGSWQLHPQ